MKDIKDADKLFQAPERTQAENMWKELSRFLLNSQYSTFQNMASAEMTAATPVNAGAGAKTTNGIFDSTGPQSVQDLASAFQGTLTNPATTWSRIRFVEDELNNDDEATAWLEAANKKIHLKFNESNFNTEIAKGYQSFTSLGNMVLLVEEDESLGFRFTSIHLSQVAWAEDKDGLVDKIYRRFRLSARQSIQKWGAKNVHPQLLEIAKKDPEKEIVYLHCIKPRKDYKEGLTSGDKRPIASKYIDIEHKHVVEESGYYEMPVMVGRWSLTPGERYGRGPGHTALPDVRTLNKIKELALRAIAKQIDPPLLANQRDVVGTINLNPGSVSLVKDTSAIAPMPSGSRPDVIQFAEADYKASIKSMFYLDKLLLPPRNETGEMTAFEVSQRLEQMQRVLGPTLSRLNFELLNPLVVRTFKILLRSEQIPQPPRIVQEMGINIEIVFVNQLARAQQMQDVNTIQQWAQSLAFLAQMDPTVIDNINSDGIAKHTAKILGVPEEAIRSDRAMEEMRTARQQAQQQAQALEAGVQAADISSKIGGNEDE